jgi:hypothetical protein
MKVALLVVGMPFDQVAAELQLPFVTAKVSALVTGHGAQQNATGAATLQTKRIANDDGLIAVPPRMPILTLSVSLRPTKVQPFPAFG